MGLFSFLHCISKIFILAHYFCGDKRTEYGYWAVGHARGYQGIRGRSSSKKGKWVCGPRTRADNNEQLMSPKEPNFLEKQCESLEPDHRANTGQKETILGRISFKKRSQQWIKKYLRRRLLPPYWMHEQWYSALQLHTDASRRFWWNNHPRDHIFD